MKKSLYTKYELITLVKQGNRSAFDYIYDQYATALFKAITGIVSDETIAYNILKEVFVYTWTRIDDYNPEKGHLFTWMYHTARAKATYMLVKKSTMIMLTLY